MNAIIPHRSQPIILSFLYPRVLPRVPVPVLRRHQSSSRRTTKRLRTKPDSSFSNAAESVNQDENLILNPPSSAPSPYHTPPAFLPPNDPRRTLLAQTFSHYNPYSDPDKKLPPLAGKGTRKTYHLTPEDFEEIRTLRGEDPWKWTRKRLAEKFNCSQFFVGMVAEASEKKKKYEQNALEKTKERWGQRKRAAREERVKRRALWGIDK